MSGAPERLVRIGYVAKAHGIRGELAIRTDEPDSTTLLDQEQLYLRDRAGRVELRRVRGARKANDAVLLALEGVEDRTAAEGLRGSEVLLPREWLPEPEADEFYAADLVGLAARRPGGEPLGRVKGLYDAGAVPVLQIDSGDRQWEIPLAEPFVKQIDVKAGVLVIEPPEEEEEA